MAYAIAIAVLLFIALMFTFSPLLALVVVVPLFVLYLIFAGLSARGDRIRGTDETPASAGEAVRQARAGEGEAPQRPAEPERETGPLPPP